ncbi:MAG TPA: DUF2842 domain-containing protein [Geminicoccaceae bacterium]|nr:DUF2842 domain-containing protein [Geminicoccaceae bacterium]
MASARSLIAIVVLVLGLGLYALIVARLGALILPPDRWLAHLVYYVAFGIVWVWPAAWIVRWAARGGGGGGGTRPDGR